MRETSQHTIDCILKHQTLNIDDIDVNLGKLMIWFPGIPYAIIQAIIKTKASMAFADDKKLTDSNRG